MLCNSPSCPDTRMCEAWLALTDLSLIPNSYSDITYNYTKCLCQDSSCKVCWPSTLMSHHHPSVFWCLWNYMHCSIVKKGGAPESRSINLYNLQFKTVFKMPRELEVYVPGNKIPRLQITNSPVGNLVNLLSWLSSQCCREQIKHSSVARSLATELGYFLVIKC